MQPSVGGVVRGLRRQGGRSRRQALPCDVISIENTNQTATNLLLSRILSFLQGPADVLVPSLLAGAKQVS